MVANAGGGIVRPFLESASHRSANALRVLIVCLDTVEDMQRHMNTNFIGTFLAYKYAAEQMILQGRGGRLIGTFVVFLSCILGCADTPDCRSVFVCWEEGHTCDGSIHIVQVRYSRLDTVGWFVSSSSNPQPLLTFPLSSGPRTTPHHRERVLPRNHCLSSECAHLASTDALIYAHRDV